MTAEQWAAPRCRRRYRPAGLHPTLPRHRSGHLPAAVRHQTSSCSPPMPRVIFQSYHLSPPEHVASDPSEVLPGGTRRRWCWPGGPDHRRQERRCLRSDSSEPVPVVVTGGEGHEHVLKRAVSLAGLDDSETVPFQLGER